MKIAFFNLEEEEKKYIENKLGELFPETVFYDDVLDKDHIPSNADFEAASVFIDSTIDKEVLLKLPKLKFIATRSTGYDHIDLKSCEEKGVVVANVPAYGENTVAEYAFALILVLSRRIYEAYNQVRERGDFSVRGLQGFDLKGKTLGVIGVGNIGKHVIKIAKGFEMNVLACDVRPDEEFSKKLEFKYYELEKILAESDIVTLHVPYIKSTHHFINKDNIKLMKKGAYLINTSRGPVVETEALVKALKDGRLGGAGLDVLEEEGVTKDEFGYLLAESLGAHNLKTVIANHVLIDMPNVIVTPHNAFNTRGALNRILDVTAENIRSFIRGKAVNVVQIDS